VNEFDSRIFDVFEAFMPEPHGRPDWPDVIRRVRSSHARKIALLVAAAVSALALAAGVTAALGGFDRWLNAQPGTPASAEEQSKFEAANGRSWAAFPKSTKLRELVETSAGGKKYVLFGFRSGNTLCLRLKAVSLGHSTQPSCTPASTLANSAKPIVIVNREFGFEDRHAHETSLFSFGIVADSVKRVDVLASDGAHRAAVGGNAYLFVEAEPNTGTHVLAVTGVRSNGTRSTISFPTTYGPFWFDQSASLPARGPTQIAAPIKHPKIGWYERGEHRGVAGNQLKLAPQQRSGISSNGRFVKPDPLDSVVVGIDGNLCLILITDGSGLSCSPGSAFFGHRGINWMMSGGGGAESFVLAGAAADGIVRVTAFGADGQDQDVPLLDNLFATRVSSSSFPVKLVGYDRLGRVSAIVTPRGPIIGPTVPAAAWTSNAASIHATGPNGARLVVRISRDVKSFRCWQAQLSSGQSRRGCLQITPATGSWVSADLVQQVGRDLFVIGETRPPVTQVKLEFADGGVFGMRPVKRLFLFAIPKRHLTAQREIAFVRGYDKNGKVVQRAPVLFRLSSG
jgi:hypothetical protein